MSTEERDRCGSVDSQSSEPSLDEDTFASHFAGIAAVSSDDELPQEPAAANGAQGPEPLSKEEKEKAWKDMLAAQDPYEADQKLPEFSFETVEVAGIQVKVRNYSGAQHRDLGTGRVVWFVPFLHDYVSPSALTRPCVPWCCSCANHLLSVGPSRNYWRTN